MTFDVLVATLRVDVVLDIPHKALIVHLLAVWATIAIRLGNIGARGIPATALKGSRSAAHGSKSASDAVLNPTLETQKAERVR